MSGYLRIGGALALGLGVVLGAFMLVGKPNTTEVSAIVPASQEKATIETSDKNGDGVPDWKEMLAARVSDTISLPTSTASITPEAYVPPTTFTGKFAEAFFQDYLSQKSVATEESGYENLIDNAVAAVNSAQSKTTYTINDLSVIPESGSALRTYGNAIAEAIYRYPREGNTEILIVQRALESNDSKYLTELAEIREVYERVLTDTKRIPVPETFTTDHLALINAYAAVAADIRAFEQIFSDPLFALAHLERYQTDIQTLGVQLGTIGKKLKQSGIVYASSQGNDPFVEPGSFFNLFNL